MINEYELFADQCYHSRRYLMAGGLYALANVVKNYVTAVPVWTPFLAHLLSVSLKPQAKDEKQT